MVGIQRKIVEDTLRVVMDTVWPDRRRGECIPTRPVPLGMLDGIVRAVDDGIAVVEL